METNKTKQQNQTKYGIKIEGRLPGKRKGISGLENRTKEDNRVADKMMFTTLTYGNTIMNSIIL